MSKSENIFLIGPMGVGKTTIGKRLAKKLDKVFLDSDKEIEKKTGATISLIFDLEGEPGFRSRESKAIDDLTLQNGIVLATGGGAILSQINRDMLSQRGVVIYLTASPELLLKRTSYDNNRPLLDTSDRLGKIISILEERDPLYNEVADIKVSVDNLQAKQIIIQISEYINKNE
ncbi:MAG: shikimate kinase [Gammaproteobacteria bacterium]|jgi:shikimate kinase